MPKILDRLRRQLAARGVAKPYAMAVGLLHKHGLMKPGSLKLTAKGRRRNAMSPAARAKTRAAKAAGRRSVRRYRYSATTNRATLRRR